MSEEPSIEALFAVACILSDLPVAPEWREAVRAHLETTLRHARFVAAFPLADMLDPAPVFVA